MSEPNDASAPALPAMAGPGADRPRIHRLEDYRPAPWLVDRVELTVVLGEDATEVDSTLELRRNPAAVTGRSDGGVPPLELDGQELELLAIELDGAPLPPARYRVTGERLVVTGLAERARLRTRVRIHPERNTSLEGLYRSGTMYCTQCEAEGFRRITWFPDRPDVLSRYRVRIEADEARYPVLLSNGNLVEQGTMAGGRHYALWEDPFPKPSYLFALVAGDLRSVEDVFRTRSGREVALAIYVEAHNAGRCGHAMASLKRAMRWDEEVYGLEYDLERFMIVAVDHFNMGAMENKGLNIFNSRYVLADPATATDTDYEHIEGIIAHEYFHNWTGNRVTCRDWFQLSLKEGLTVFRDQQFSADIGSAAVKRINDVRILRTAQFREDAGPMAHPVRPESYLEINNFYTVTVYNKGAEVIRMMHTLLGSEGFRRGMDLYFARHDGQAVTTEDFVQAMEDANGTDLRQFRRWYTQAGTPEITFEERWIPEEGTLELTLHQRTPPTADGSPKEPFHIPVAAGLLSPEGRSLPIEVAAERNLPGSDEPATRVLELREPSQSFRLTGLRERPVVSLLRGFSAPVRIVTPRDDETLIFLLGHDPDPFSRWDAGQTLALQHLVRMIGELRQGTEPTIPDALLDAWARVLADESLDPAFTAELLKLPGEGYVGEQLDEIDVQAVHEARSRLRQAMAGHMAGPLENRYRSLRLPPPYRYDPDSAGRRALAGTCLALLTCPPGEEGARGAALALEQLERADNMTEALAALQALAERAGPEREQALALFEERWREEPLVLDKWFAVQASSSVPGTLERVRALMAHPRFELTNPNRVRALVGSFVHANPVHFHAADGSGYRFAREVIETLDPLNPQLAARLASAFTTWRRYPQAQREAMREVMTGLLARPGLSGDTYEILSKSLGTEGSSAQGERADDA